MSNYILFIGHLVHLVYFINHAFQVESDQSFYFAYTKIHISIPLLVSSLWYEKKLDLEIKYLLNQSNAAVKLQDAHLKTNNPKLKVEIGFLKRLYTLGGAKVWGDVGKGKVEICDNSWSSWKRMTELLDMYCLFPTWLSELFFMFCYPSKIV